MPGKEKAMEKERFIGYLKTYHLGAERAIKSKILESLFDMKGKELRNLVNVLRRDGIPICSDGNGYFYAKDEQEIRTTIKHMKNRIAGINAAINGLQQCLSSKQAPKLKPSRKGGDHV